MYAATFIDTTISSVGVALSNLLVALPAIIDAGTSPLEARPTGRRMSTARSSP